MRRSLLIAATFAVAASSVQAEDTPPSNSPPLSDKGPNFPTPQHGPAYPAGPSKEEPAPSFGTQAPVPESRDVPLQALPEQRNYPSEQRENPASPER